MKQKNRKPGWLAAGPLCILLASGAIVWRQDVSGGEYRIRESTAANAADLAGSLTVDVSRSMEAVNIADCLIADALKSKEAIDLAGSLTVDTSENAAANMAADMAEDVSEGAAETSSATRTPQLSEIQQCLLDRLSDSLKLGQLDEAADLMFENQQQLWYIWHHVMGERTYIYDNGQICELYGEQNRTGLVLRKPSEVFFGDFADGKPEGECAALQVIRLDTFRYDYAKGNWKNGRMEGQGTVGYCCFRESLEESGTAEEARQAAESGTAEGVRQTAERETAEGERQAVERETVEGVRQFVARQGKFRGDRMDGPVRYETAGAGGEITVWHMTAENGALVLDENWSYDDREKVYQMRAEQNEACAFVVSEEEAGEIRFQNLIKWE